MKLVQRLARLGELLLALRRSGGRAGRAAQMELRAARAAARRRVGAYTAIVTAVGFAWLALAESTPALGRVRQGVGLPGLGVGHAAGDGAGGRRGRPDQPRSGPDPRPLPTVAVYLACRGAIQADREQAQAGAAAEQAQATAAEQARLAWSTTSRP